MIRTSALRRILAEEGLIKTSIDWEQFAQTPEKVTWRNYNTLGTRKFIGTLLQILGTREPSSIRILFKKDAPEEHARLTKKWWGKGHNVKERGVAGRVVMKGGKSLFLGTVGGDEVIVQGPQFKLGSSRDFDYEGPDFGVRLWREGPRDEIVLYWPLENIGRRGRMVEVRDVSTEGARIAWGPTFLDQVKRARDARQANAMLDDLKGSIEEKGDRVWYDRTETVKGIDKSLPTPKMYKMEDIKGPDITIDLNAKPIEVYSESDSDKWHDQRMTYWFQVHPRFKRKLHLMRDALSSARGLNQVGKLLDGAQIPYDYHTYMMPGWD